jgi:phenol hydroxylase P3 protein
MDYMLPKKVMSWKEAFELYFEQQMLDGLFTDLAFYGIRPPMGVEQAIAEKEYISHQLYWLLYEFCFAACFHATVPPDEELDWMSEQYPMFDQHFRPRLEKARRMEQEGNRYFYRGLPLICQTCQIPMGFSEPGDPATISFRRSEFRGEQYNFCSDPCKWIFDREPEKYCQAWLPPHQVFQGNCGGGTIPEVLAWYGVEDGVDNGEYLTSPDHESWVRWHAPEPLGGGA